MGWCGAAGMRAGFLAALLAAFLAFPYAPAAQEARPVSLTGRHIAGYQGWFGCPGDARGGADWTHWFVRGPDGALRPAVEMLPDTTEMAPDEGCPTDWTSPAGRPLRLYSAQDPRTVERHFAWMQRYGIDGVAVQRFLSAVSTPDGRAQRNQVLDNVRRAAERHGRGFFVMYDLSGGTDERLAIVLEDWKALLASGVVDSPAYQHHRGQPVLGLWGIGFANRALTPEGVAAFLAALRVATPGGVTLLGGVPAGWRTGDAGASPDPAWRAVFRGFEVLSPWTVGLFGDPPAADRYRSDRLAPDLRETARTGQDLMPVIFPGFSWSNLMRTRGRVTPLNQIRRRCGAFYWRQGANAVGAGARMLYTAMFDEVDEGTAIFKLAPNPRSLPAEAGFLPLDADGCALPPDWYLRLAGEIGRGVAASRLPVDIPPALNATLAAPAR